MNSVDEEHVSSREEPVHDKAIGLGELSRTFGKIGLLSFGGPAGQISLMHSVLVEEKRWIDDKRFLHALNFCMLLPGPEAMQLATYCGWLTGGTRGGLIAGSLFVLPGALVLILLSGMYMAFAEVPIFQGLLFGLKAAVLAIVLQALARVSAKALNGVLPRLLAATAFVALFVFSLPFPLVIAVAAMIGLLLPSRFGEIREELITTQPVIKPWRHVGKVAVWALVFWVLPVFALLALLGNSHVYSEQALFFSKTSMVTFGGAYAVLAYVGQQAVEVYSWLQPDEMVTGLGLAETTPGPLILVLLFVGFVGAFRDSGLLDPFVAGTLGAGVTLWVTFVPCFIWIFMGAPFMERLRGNQTLSAAFAAITAAVVGVIANLSIWFAIHVLFSDVTSVGFAGSSVDLPVISSLDWRALAVVLLAGTLVLAKRGLFTVLGACTLAGIVLYMMT